MDTNFFVKKYGGNLSEAQKQEMRKDIISVIFAREEVRVYCAILNYINEMEPSDDFDHTEFADFVLDRFEYEV